MCIQTRDVELETVSKGVLDCCPTLKQPPTLDVEISTERPERRAPTEEEKLALVKRIAESSHFRRSVRLCDFLLYVSRQGIRNPAAEIHEQEIGAKVFGRSPHYDRSQDNIVRVNATELRKRIDLYYATEGIDETLAVTVPRGGYMPVFNWRRPDTSLHPAELDRSEAAMLSAHEGPTALTSFASVPVHTSHGPETAIRRWPWITATITLAIVCVGLLWALLRSTKSPDARNAPTVMAFWSDFARGNQTDIVLPDESISVMEDMLKRPTPLSDYLDRNYVTGLDSLPVSDDRKADVRELLNHNLVTLGAVNAAKQILLLPGLAPKFHLTVSRFYSADAMKRNNTVFVGGKKSNPWVSLFEPATNFRTYARC